MADSILISILFCLTIIICIMFLYQPSIRRMEITMIEIKKLILLISNALNERGYKCDAKEVVPIDEIIEIMKGRR